MYFESLAVNIGEVGPQVSSNVAEQPRYIRWTASTGEPFFSFGQVLVTRSELVDICEPGTTTGHTSQDRIVEAEFHDIRKSAIEVNLKQALCKHHDSNPSTGFVVATAFISTLRQKIIDSEAFPFVLSTNTTGQRHLTVYHVVPQSHQRRVLSFRISDAPEADQVSVCG